jgi:hypothetical protein
MKAGPRLRDLAEAQGAGRCQATAMRALWASVVLEAVGHAIREDAEHKDSSGSDALRHWAGTRDGREVFQLAGIDHSPRAVEALYQFAKRGISPYAALATDKSVARRDLRAAGALQ